MRGTRVTAEDLETGETQTVTLYDDYVVVTEGRCEMTYVNAYSNGTVIITIKKRAADAT